MTRWTPNRKELHDIMTFIHTSVCDIIYEYSGNPFAIIVNISNPITTIPMIDANGQFYIDWGDDTYSYSHGYKTNINHVYRYAGLYVIHIFGDITRVSFSNMIELVEISQWGNLRLICGRNAFSLCKNLSITARDLPNLKYAVNLTHMFSGCQLGHAQISYWDVSNITHMSHMFSGCSRFNADLSMWDVSAAIDVSDMFHGCILFNSDLSKWGVGNVINMSYMFAKCCIFNSDLSNWNVYNVMQTNKMFEKCYDFNADLSRWDVSNVSDMSSMFYECYSFNSNLCNWNIINASDMSFMFYKCIIFDSDLSCWDVINVVDLSYMFSGCQNSTTDLSRWTISPLVLKHNIVDIKT